MTVPFFKGNSIVGVVGLANKETDYDQVDVLQLSLLMASVWKVTDRIKSEETLRKQAHDLEIFFKVRPGRDHQWSCSGDMMIEVNASGCFIRGC